MFEIIHYAIFTKLVAINDNGIFHDKGEEFLLTIIFLYRFLLRERNTIIMYVIYIPLSAQRHGSRELFVITVEPRLSDIGLTDLPRYPSYTEPSIPL